MVLLVVRTGQTWWLPGIEVHAVLPAVRRPIVEILEDRQNATRVVDDWRGWRILRLKRRSSYHSR